MLHLAMDNFMRSPSCISFLPQKAQKFLCVPGTRTLSHVPIAVRPLESNHVAVETEIS